MDPQKIVQFCDDPKQYLQNLHTPKSIHYLKTPQNIEIQYFEPQKMTRA